MKYFFFLLFTIFIDIYNTNIHSGLYPGTFQYPWCLCVMHTPPGIVRVIERHNVSEGWGGQVENVGGGVGKVCVVTLCLILWNYPVA